MNETEALGVAALVAELWPSQPMAGVRQAFYARALTTIPTQAAAMDAVSTLFVDERFQPAPGDIIDRALGGTQGALDAWQLLTLYAYEIHAGRPCPGEVPDAAYAALRACGERLSGLAALVERPGAMDKLRDRFLIAYRDQSRAEAAGKLPTAATMEELP